jgi:hypothetical protein
MNFNLNTFSSTYLAPAIIILGLFGNLFGLIVISKKKLVKIGSQIVYIALFIFDLLKFLLIFQPYTLFAFNIDITTFSSLICKTYFYINFAFGSISPFLNVYISVERYISIAYSAKKDFLRKKKIQLRFIIALILFNLILYVPTVIKVELQSAIIENLTVCNFDDYFWQQTYGYIDLSNRVILPFGLMIIFSILIIHTIFTSRMRMTSNTRANRTFRKDVKFSLISVTLNASYIVFSLPIAAIYLQPSYQLNTFIIFFVFIYNIAYSANFYLIFLANSLFREGFYSIFTCSKIRRNTNIAVVVVRETIELQNNRQTN